MENEIARQISYVLYSSSDEEVKINALVKDETIWLTQKAMAELFSCSSDNIGLHLKNIYETQELEKNRTAEEISVVQKEGSRSVKRNLTFYNLDAIISVGYRVNSSEVTKQFYATVQNKFHYAITGQTAAEIVYDRADHEKEHMGLTTWKNSPDGRILKSDVNVAKNYLSEKQIRQLERAVSGYFDYIEDLIEREIPFDMKAFAKSVNEFLEFRKYDILEGNGGISRTQADEKSFAEYEIFNKTQKINSDFDKMIKQLENHK